MGVPIPKTLEEAISCSDHSAVLQWLETASARDIQQYLHRPRALRMDIDYLFQFINTALNIRLSEDAAATANKLSDQTDKLVVYTKQLKILTWALVFVGAVQLVVMLFEVFHVVH